MVIGGIDCDRSGIRDVVFGVAVFKRPRNLYRETLVYSVRLGMTWFFSTCAGRFELLEVEKPVERCLPDGLVTVQVDEANEAVIRSWEMVISAYLDLSKAGADHLSRSSLEDRLAQRGLF